MIPESLTLTACGIGCTSMKETPLLNAHRSLHAKLVEFAGWQMPIQYTGVLDEYQAVRHAAGIFDVSHMGRLRVEGGQAQAFLQWVSTNDAGRLDIGQAQYGMICNEKGGILDDVFVYRTETDAYLICVNASNREKIHAWVLEHQRKKYPDVIIRDESDDLAQVAIQGPAASRLLQKLFGTSISAIKPRHCLAVKENGWSGLLSRTGYTGEIGYEWYLPAGMAPKAWEALLEVGTEEGLKPAGLGARDLLRLDVGYLLYGNDMDERTSPLEANAEWVVAWNKEPFVGQDALLKQKEQGVSRILVGFEMKERGIPRHDMPILKDGNPVGTVTSGNFSPILQKGIGLGYLPPVLAVENTEVEIDIRGKRIPALIVRPPFYKRPKS